MYTPPYLLSFDPSIRTRIRSVKYKNRSQRSRYFNHMIRPTRQRTVYKYQQLTMYVSSLDLEKGGQLIVVTVIRIFRLST